MSTAHRYPHVFTPLDLGFTRSTPQEAEAHKLITRAAHAADAEVKICLQILHTGALAGTPDCVAPSPLKSRTARYTPNELDEAGIEKQLADSANCAALAQAAGYDGAGGVEYLKLDDAGLHTRVNGEPRLFAVVAVILCAGQTPLRTVAAAGLKAHLVGGAYEAAELDAKRAIDQASRLAAEV